MQNLLSLIYLIVCCCRSVRFITAILTLYFTLKSFGDIVSPHRTLILAKKEVVDKTQWPGRVVETTHEKKM